MKPILIVIAGPNGAGKATVTERIRREKNSFVAQARASGYFVRSFFVGTSDPTINAARFEPV